MPDRGAARGGWDRLGAEPQPDDFGSAERVPWSCAQCGRRVPRYVDRCRCGERRPRKANRPKAVDPPRQRHVVDTAPRSRRWERLAPILLAHLVVCVLILHRCAYSPRPAAPPVEPTSVAVPSKLIPPFIPPVALPAPVPMREAAADAKARGESQNPARQPRFVVPSPDEQLRIQIQLQRDMADRLGREALERSERQRAQEQWEMQQRLMRRQN